MSTSQRTTSTWWLGWLIALALIAQAGRILTTRSSTGETPFHSANDRSRWASVAALGNYGRFEIDDVIARKDPQTGRRIWDSIDKVRHRGRDGRQHYYSSKPPLLSSLHAAVYAAIRASTGLDILNYPFTVARSVLLIVNWIPLALFWWLWARYWQQQLLPWWTTTLIMVFMTWGTFVSTFANTLNNHLPGAIAAGVSLWALLKIIYGEQRKTSNFILACAAAAMCAVCELPALAWTAAVIALLVQINLRQTLVGIAVGMLPLALAFAIINYWAHGDLRPPYAHRAVGPLVTQVQLAPADSALGQALGAKPDLQRLLDNRRQLLEALRAQSWPVSDQAVVRASRTPEVYELWDETTQYRFALTVEDTIRIHHWDDWYDYPNSYWYPENKKGVDRGEPDRWVYLFHATFGHHGLFSLTPMWLLIPLGVAGVWRAVPGHWWTRAWDLRVQVMLAIVGTSLVCFVFYMARPLEDRNYGGVSCGFRWMHWFAPLWCWLVGRGLMLIPPRVSLSQAIVLALLAISIYSAVYPWQNPWTPPWLM